MFKIKRNKKEIWETLYETEDLLKAHFIYWTLHENFANDHFGLFPENLVANQPEFSYPNKHEVISWYKKLDA